MAESIDETEAVGDEGGVGKRGHGNGKLRVT